MKIKVVYVVNGDTQLEVLEAPFITHCISQPKIGSVILRNEKLAIISKHYYSQCEKLEVIFDVKQS